jgi:quinol monooxygenase YgiN
MIKVVAKNYFKPGMLNEVTELVKEMVEKTCLEDGCISYEFCASDSDPDMAAFIESWRDQAALDAHMKTEHFTRIIPMIGEYTSKELEIETFTKLV